MYDKMFNDFLIAKWIIYVMKVYLIYDLHIIYVAKKAFSSH